MKVAFDIDDTLWKIEKYECPIICLKQHDHNNFRQVPDYDLIAVLRWFANNGDEVFVWSAGGVDYAQTIVDRLGLTSLVTVIPKISSAKQLQKRYEGMDIAFDDCETNLAKVDVRVKRKYDESTKT